MTGEKSFLGRRFFSLALSNISFLALFGLSTLASAAPHCEYDVKGMEEEEMGK